MTEIGNRLKQLTPEQLEAFANEFERSRSELLQLKEPIVISGMSCRFPGSANTPEDLWQLLIAQKDVCQTVPADREWSSATNMRGYFIDDPFRFDAELFAMTPREAKAIDPQQRILLELSWLSMQSAGYWPKAMSGSRTGIFVGCYADDYAHQLIWSNEVEAIDAHTSSGTSHGAGVGRVAHVFNFKGPAMAIDTACSSSLVAVHLAMESLRRRECDYAIAGGISLSLSSQVPMVLNRAKMISEDGYSKTFDRDANGYGRGEGGGLVFLRRLSDAEAEKDIIRATIYGSAINHDGRASSLTAPNGDAQVSVIRQALSNAGRKLSDIDMIECHGTGTPLGDPIEVHSLKKVFDKDGNKNCVHIGSVKSNIGHLEAAAGIAGLIKTVLSLENEQIPATLHVDHLNPEIGDDLRPISIATKSLPWEKGQRPRFAGVSSFGFGGTNAHMIIGEGAKTETEYPSTQVPGRLLTINAPTFDSIVELAKLYAHAIRAKSVSLADLCYTANLRQGANTCRTVINASTDISALQDLDLIGNNILPRDQKSLLVENGRTNPILFMFVGQGSQFSEMGRILFERADAFKQGIIECNKYLEPHFGFSLFELLYGNLQSKLNETEYVQAAIFSYEYAVVRLLNELGINPSGVIGHSLGEYIAAVCAGTFDLETALNIIVKRSKFISDLPAGGAMAVLCTEPEYASNLAKDYDVDIAAFNSHFQTVVSGPESSLDRLKKEAQKNDVDVISLDVSHAFHSCLMDPILESFRDSLRSKSFHAPSIDFYSSLTCNKETDKITTVDYWVRHLRQPVRFATTLAQASEADYRFIVEVGPRPMLSGIAQKMLPSSIHVLPAGKSDEQILSSIGHCLEKLYLAGEEINWSSWQKIVGGNRASIPSIALAGEHFINQASLRGERNFSAAIDRKERQTFFLENKESIPGQNLYLYRKRLGFGGDETCKDHKLLGNVVVPGAYYIAFAKAIADTFYRDSYRITDIRFFEPLTLNNNDCYLITAVCKRVDKGLEVSIYCSINNKDEKLSSLSIIGGKTKPIEPRRIDSEKLCKVSDFYAEMHESGYQLGTSFQWLHDVQRGEGLAKARLKNPAGLYNENYGHPGFFDACFQLFAAALTEQSSNADKFIVPATVDEITVSADIGASLEVEALIEPTANSSDALVGNLAVYDEHGNAVISMNGFCAHGIKKAKLAPRQTYPVAFIKNQWKTIDKLHQSTGKRTFVIGANALEKKALETLMEGVAFCEHNREISLNDIDTDRILYFIPKSSKDVFPFDYLQTQDSGLLLIVNALAKSPDLCSRLVVINHSNAKEIGSDIEPAVFGLQAFIRSLCIEVPELSCSMINIASEVALDEFFASALEEEKEPILAIYKEELKVPRLVVCEQSTNNLRKETLTVNEDCSYLVTGGAGSLGRQAVLWLLEEGAGRVVLCGRSNLDRETGQQSELLQLLANNQNRVEYHSVDVSDSIAFSQFIKEQQRQNSPWKGAIHAAGIKEDSFVVNANDETMRNVMAPKIVGANVLASEFKNPDWLIFFSSVTSILGSPGQAHYAYANAYLDGLTTELASTGIAAYSLGLAPFAGDGMAEEAGKYHRNVFKLLKPSAIGYYIKRAVETGESVTALVDPDLSKLIRIYPNANYLEYLTPTAVITKKTEVLNTRLTPARIKSLSVAKQPGELATDLAYELSTIIEENAADIAVDAPLHSIGIDSMMALEFKTLIEKTLGINVPVAQLLKGPSLLELSDFILTALDQKETGPESDPNEIDVDKLTDEQVRALLESKLGMQNHVAE